MKLIFFIMLSLSINCNETSSKNGGFCSLLREAFSSEHLQREFSLCKDETSFILYDKKIVLKNCGLFNACGKAISITYDEKYDKLSPNDNRSTKDKSVIILHRLEIKGENYTLYFWRPYSGAAVNLIYKKSGDKFDLVDHTIGTF